MLKITPIPAFLDNYIWMIERAGYAAVVDPGDARPVLDTLRLRGLRLAAILITHHHPDHIGGIAPLLAAHPVPVYGPRAESRSIPQLTRLLAEGDRVELPELDLSLDVLEVPGHTLGHIAYKSADKSPIRLFCGDTLFSAGCGRLFEGTAAQLYESLQKFKGLDADTLVYCTHEYTLSNLAFAAAAEPGNPDIEQYHKEVMRLRAQGQPSLPSNIGLERRVNPFLRVDQPAIMRTLRQKLDPAPADPPAVFAALRRWKDQFRAA